MSMLLAELETTVNRIAEGLPRTAGEAAPGSQPFSTMPPVVHRVVERQAALRAGAVALRDGDRSVTWRELNHRANAVARHLMANGLRRGDVAQVEMPLGADLAIVLLAVLKAGGCYAWTPDTYRAGQSPRVVIGGSGTEQALLVEVTHLLAGTPCSSPNLPVMVRGADAACVLESGESPVLVPHASLAALRQTPTPEPAQLSGEPGAFALWILLMGGLTVTIAAPYAYAA